MESKKDIRRRVLTKRSEMKGKEWEENSYRIYEKVVAHPFFLNADTVYCYVDYRREVGTRNIIEKAWKLGKKVAVPKVEGAEMNFYYIHSFDDLKCGYKGILEPDILNPAQGESGLIIFPGAAYDRHCNRIGYGGGYYDKYMGKHEGLQSIALAFECQIEEHIPAEIHDIKPDIIITEEHIYVK